MAAEDRQEEGLGLYERLLRDAAQVDPKENPDREKQQESMRAYVGSRRRAVPESGGYVPSEEMRKQQERRLADLQALRNLLVNGAKGPYGGYRLAYLKRKYPTEYAHLSDIQVRGK
jgi:hypothetical protein